MKLKMFEEFIHSLRLNELGDSNEYAELTWGKAENYDFAKFKGSPGKFIVKFDILNKTLSIDFDRDDKASYDGTPSDALWVLKNVVNALGLYFVANKEAIKMLKFKSCYESDPLKADKRIEIYKNYLKSWASKSNTTLTLISQSEQEDSDDDNQPASCLYSVTY